MASSLPQRIKYLFNIKVNNISGLELSQIRGYYQNDINNSNTNAEATVTRARSMSISRPHKLELVWRRGNKFEGILEDVVLLDKDEVLWKDAITFEDTLLKYDKYYTRYMLTLIGRLIHRGIITKS